MVWIDYLPTEKLETEGMAMFDRVLQIVRDQQKQSYRDQAQREALIDLLVWTMVVDKSAASIEAHQIHHEATALAWEGTLPLDAFIAASARRVSALIGDTAAETRYLDEIHGRLGTAEMRQRALAACDRLIDADGKRTPAEGEFLERVTARFSA